jgi:GntR family transcriptional regulator, transcriptional repressor for pyruvate dehydrogenase complex
VRERAPRATLADEVAENLKRQILSGIYAPGDKLPAELTLASALAVNRFTVREAMNKLEQLHLIARRPGAGTVVLDYTSHASVDVIENLVLTGDGVVNTELLANLLEFARVLSSEIAALAAERRSDDDLAALDVIVARMRGEKNLSKLLWLDFDFNWTLAGAARNLVPRLLMNSVRGLLTKYSHLLETLWVSAGSITQGYEHVVEAVRGRDAERARALLRSIWEGRHARFVAAARRESRPPRTETR